MAQIYKKRCRKPFNRALFDCLQSKEQPLLTYALFALLQSRLEKIFRRAFRGKLRSLMSRARWLSADKAIKAVLLLTKWAQNKETFSPLRCRRT